MLQMIIKVLITTGVILAAAELSNRSTKAAALLISLPLTTILMLCWIRYDRGPGAEAAAHLAKQTTSVLWLVIGSIPFFLVLPPLLRRSIRSPPMSGQGSSPSSRSLGASIATTAAP